MIRNSSILALATLALAACPATYSGLTTSPVDCSSDATATDSSTTTTAAGRFTLNDGAGNVLKGKAPASTVLTIKRAGGTKNRRVNVTANQPVDSVTVTLNITGCPTTNVAVGWKNGSNWDLVGGTVLVSGTTTTITSDTLDHLSTYALVGN